MGGGGERGGAFASSFQPLKKPPKKFLVSRAPLRAALPELSPQFLPEPSLTAQLVNVQARVMQRYAFMGDAIWYVCSRYNVARGSSVFDGMRLRIFTCADLVAQIVRC
jgi:hypothetical protein